MSEHKLPCGICGVGYFDDMCPVHGEAVMPNPEARPRERFFMDHGTIHDSHTGRHVFGEDRPNPKFEALELLNSMHSAYLKVCAERDESGIEIEDMKDVYYDIVKLCGASGTEDVRMDLTLILEERDSLRKERDELIKRYRNIELANEMMSRNDHEHFGDLLVERDSLKSEVERLRAGLEWIAGIDESKPYCTYYERTLDDGTAVPTFSEIARNALEGKP